MFEKTKIFAESWNVAYRKQSPGTILFDCKTPFTIIKNAKRYWAADPFVFEYNGNVYIFAELYDYVRGRGILGYCEITDGGASEWTPIIVEENHLSFPYIFQKGDNIYIMPESSASGCLYLYQAVEFPDKWEEKEMIRDHVRYADTTLLTEQERLYALTYCVEDSFNLGLHLLDIKAPEKDKKLELSNQNLRRPAGRILERENIRCAQNCIEDYGKGLVFYKYELKNGTYNETEVKRLYSEDVVLSTNIYRDGMHTYNFSEHYEVIDIKTRRFSIVNLFFRIYFKIKKKLMVR